MAVEMMTIPVIHKREKDQKRPSFSAFSATELVFSIALEGGKKSKSTGPGPRALVQLRDF